MAELRIAPTDEAAEAAYDEIMKLAEAHALIIGAYGGVATLAIPREQRTRAGLRERVLQAHAFAQEVRA